MNPASRTTTSTAASATTQHVAVIKAEYLAAILEGRKTIESRLMKTRREPFQRVFPGDCIYFRPPGGRYQARAIVQRAEHLADLTPAQINAIRRRHNREILGPAEYWQAKREARYATLLWLQRVEPTSDGPIVPPMFGRGWAIVTPANHRRSA